MNKIVQPGTLQWVKTREHMRGNRDISMICNTSHGRWIYHKAQREVAITHTVVCAMFPVLSAGQTAQRPGSWTETAWLSVMKLSGSQVHLPFCIAVSEQSHLQTQWEKPRSILKKLLSTSILFWRFEMRCDFVCCVGSSAIIWMHKTNCQNLWIQFGEYWSLLLPPPASPLSQLVNLHPPFHLLSMEPC